MLARQAPQKGILLAIGAVSVELFLVLFRAGEIDATSVLVFPVIVISIGLLWGERALAAATAAVLVLVPLMPVLGRLHRHEPPFGIKDAFNILIVEVVLAGAAVLGRTVLRTYHRILEATEQSRLHYASLFRHSPDGLIELDEQHHIVEANPVAQAMLGLDAGARPTLGAALAGAGALQPLLSLAGGMEAASIELETKSGRRVLEATTRTQVAPEGRTLLVLRDITERRRREQERTQELRLEVVGRLAGGVAHEFNNLLTVIGGHAGLLKDHLDARVQAGAGQILEAHQRAALLTGKLLAFAQHDYHEPVVFSLAKEIADVAEVLRQVAGPKHRIALRGGAAGCLRADRRHLEQILSHLIANARDASPEGGDIELHVAGLAADEARGLGSGLDAPRQLLLEIVDQGAGMADSVRRRLFEPFFTTKPPGKGTGMGLAAVYGLVTQNDGTVDVVSRPGSGTRVRLFFPEAARA